MPKFDLRVRQRYHRYMLVESQTHEEMIISFLSEAGEDFTSGNALSDKLGLSRTAIWKYVEDLRRVGYKIEASPSKGYRLVEVPDRLTSLELAPYLTTRDIGRTIHYHESLASTNTTAFELAVHGAQHGEIVIAEEQTKGRGRRGREWSSPKQHNVYFSVVLRPELTPQRTPELTLVAAVALAETLKDAHIPVTIKWPNDVMVGRKKIAGILTELSAEADSVNFVILGIGINVNTTEKDFEGPLSDIATSMFVERKSFVPRALLAAALWAKLETWLDVHQEQGFDAVRHAWLSMSQMVGTEVLVKTERSEFRGVTLGINESGALLVRTESGLETILAGDVEQVRPKKTPSF